jgi:hypothetical protein
VRQRDRKTGRKGEQTVRGRQGENNSSLTFRDDIAELGSSAVVGASGVVKIVLIFGESLLSGIHYGESAHFWSDSGRVVELFGAKGTDC